MRVMRAGYLAQWEEKVRPHPVQPLLLFPG